MTDTDALLRAVRAGDESALRTLYEWYSTNVYALAYAITRNREAAEEVTQDAFLRVWHRAEQYQLGTNFRAWLLQLTRNLAIDYLRRNRKRLEPNPVWELDSAATENDSPHEEAYWIEHALHHHVSTEQRQAIELAFLQGFTHEQIAQRLNTPLGTIKTRIRDGLRRLRDAWEGEQH